MLEQSINEKLVNYLSELNDNAEFYNETGRCDYNGSVYDIKLLGDFKYKNVYTSVGGKIKKVNLNEFLSTFIPKKRILVVLKLNNKDCFYGRLDIGDKSDVVKDVMISKYNKRLNLIKFKLVFTCGVTGEELQTEKRIVLVDKDDFNIKVSESTIDFRPESPNFLI